MALRRGILAAVAARNSLRRPRQSLLVVLGLLVGTALISGALVSGDSMEYAIVEATFFAFQEIDETVYLDSYNFFPQTVAEALATDAALAAATDAVGANILWDASASNPRTGQYEPSVRLVGFDPIADRPFGPFRNGDATFTGEALGESDIVLHEDIAETLGAGVGDEIVLNFTRPHDPLLPTFSNYTGQVNLSVATPIIGHAEPQPWTTSFSVDATTTHLSAILVWDPAQGQDLDLEIVDPDQLAMSNNDGTTTQPDVPAILNVTGSLAEPLPRGQWTLRVHAKAAAETPFAVTVAQFQPVYDLEEFQRRVEDLQRLDPTFDPSQAELRVDRYTETARVAFIATGGKGPHFQLPDGNNLFLRLSTLQGWLDRDGQVNLVKVSNPGGVEGGVESTDDVLPILRERLDAVKAASPDHAAIQALKANNDKQFWLDQARQVGTLFSALLTFIASFSVIAGLMLIVNIITMLAEERRMELGISRAVGMRRGDLTRLFTIEGALYALPAAVLGTFAGLLLAFGLVWGFNTFGDPRFFPPIPYRIEGPSLLVAFSTGILLTLATIYVGARRASRLNIVRAVRNLEEPERLRDTWSLWGGLSLLAAGAAATLLAAFAEQFWALVLGPTGLAAGTAFLLRRRFQRRRIYPPIAGLLFAFLTLTVFTVRKYDTVEANVFAPLRAVLMALCLVIIVVYNEAAARGAGRLFASFRRLRAVARPAMSYPLHRKFRTGLTVSMFSVILLVVVLFSIFGSIFTPNPEKEAGGYDVQAFTNAPLARLEDAGDDPTALDQVASYAALPFYVQYGGDLVDVDNETTAQFGPPADHIFAIDASFAQGNRFALIRRSSAYASDADAYAAVARDPDLVIVAYTYSTDEQGNDDVHGVGSEVQVTARGSIRTFQIVGVQEQVHFKGIFVARAAFDEMFANPDTLFLIRTAEGTDPATVAKSLEAAYQDVGMDAASIRDEVLVETQTFRQIFTLIQLFLSLGLVVGILSLGIVTARSVIERRQEIGMMRALGYRRRDIRRVFLLETLMVVTLGVAIGAVVALVVSFGLWVAVVRDLRIPYTVPWVELAAIAVTAYVATTLATLAPIFRAARTPPAEALRYIE